MGQILLIAFATYLLYNFIFRFVIPLVRVTRQVKRQVRNFQQQAGNMQGGFNAGGYQAGSFQQATGYGQTNNGPGYSQQAEHRENGNQQTGSQQADPTRKSQQTQPKKDDYIDFEEIK